MTASGSLELPINDPPKNPDDPNYLLGQIVAELRALNKKVDNMDKKLDNHNARFEKIEKSIEDLSAWKNEHIKWHVEDERLFKISKTTFWGLIGALIASGLLMNILLRIVGG